MGNDIRRKTVRVSRDAVSGKLETVALTDEQQALERCLNYIDGTMLTFGADNAKCHRLAAAIAQAMRAKQPHTDADLLEGTSLSRAEALLAAERAGG